MTAYQDMIDRMDRREREINTAGGADRMVRHEGGSGTALQCRPSVSEGEGEDLRKESTGRDHSWHDIGAGEGTTRVLCVMCVVCCVCVLCARVLFSFLLSLSLVSVESAAVSVTDPCHRQLQSE